MSRQPKIAVLGTGRMGSALARAFLKQNYQTTVWNRTPSKLAPLTELGARAATSPADAVAGADAIYTDVWASMGEEAEADSRRIVFAPYQVNRELMAAAAPDALFMHCLPAHRGDEVTEEVIESPASVVFDQAENRLHTQKALLALLLGR